MSKPTIEELRQSLDRLFLFNSMDTDVKILEDAITELRELRKESDKSEGIIAHASTALINCAEQRDTLQAKLEKAKEYMRHKGTCNNELYAGYACDCGYIETLKRRGRCYYF